MPSALLQVSLWPDLLAWLPLAAAYDDDGFEALVKIKLEIFQKKIRFIEEHCGGNDADIANGIQACIDKINGALADGSPAYWPSRAARRMQIQIWIVEGDGFRPELDSRISQRNFAEREHERQRQKDEMDMSMYRKRAE